MMQQDRIALRVGDDGTKARTEQAKDGIHEAHRRGVIAELNEQVARVVDRIAAGILQRVLHVLVGDVEIAAQRKLQPRKAVAQLIEFQRESVAVVLMLEISMRSSHNVAHAVVRGLLTHLQRGLPTLGAVVGAGQDVGVNVDHARLAISVPTGAHSPPIPPLPGDSSHRRRRMGIALIPLRSTMCKSYSDACRICNLKELSVSDEEHVSKCDRGRYQSAYSRLANRHSRRILKCVSVV